MKNSRFVGCVREWQSQTGDLPKKLQLRQVGHKGCAQVEAINEESWQAKAVGA